MSVSDTGKQIASAIVTKAIFSNPTVLLVGLIISIIFLIIMLIAVAASALNPNQQNEEGTSYSIIYGPLDRDKIDSILKESGVFDGKTDVFIETAKRHNIDPVLLIAIALHETGYGTSNAVIKKNNPGGIMMPPSYSELRAYPSLDAGIEDMAKNLYDNYIAIGLVTIPQIGTKYAPIGADNDPTGSNANWVPSITNIATQLGGLTINYFGDGKWIVPVPKPFTLSSDYGWRDFGGGEFHNGIDIPKPAGTPIVAASSGKVVVAVKSGEGGGFGLHVVIEHSGGVYSLYGHMSSVKVNVGDTVQTGQQIGAVGNTGRSTGNHLHFQINLNSIYQNHTDPKPYIGL